MGETAEDNQYGRIAIIVQMCDETTCGFKSARAREFKVPVVRGRRALAFADLCFVVGVVGVVRDRAPLTGCEASL